MEPCPAYIQELDKERVKDEVLTPIVKVMQISKRHIRFEVKQKIYLNVFINLF